jgi:signal transduction histidine kinase
VNALNEDIMAHDRSPAPAASPWQVLQRLRWPLGGAIAIAFALGQLLETLVFGPIMSERRLIFDVIGWGVLGGVAVWFSLTWVSRQERRYQAGVEQALREQQELNRQLQRSNSQLALLSDVNRHIAESATLDEILNAALQFPQRLLQFRAGVVMLHTPDGIIETRVTGASVDQIHVWRSLLQFDHRRLVDQRPHLALPPDARDELACLLVPLFDSSGTVGHLELYVDRTTTIPTDELLLLQTIASEIAEAIVSARRRSREERAIYELERAIADERARIARDIHDGIAQTLAFRRMRIDLWLDWLQTDPERLRKELIENKQILREQIAELRRAIFALRPVQFDELGFIGGLHRYITEFASQHHWQVQIDLAGAPGTLSPEDEAICFRLIQESLTNVAKHADATEVSVRITQADGGLAVMVRDNGGGFDPGAAVERSGHVGLRQMQERMEAIRGQVIVLSKPGAGTEVRAWLPLHELARERISA